MKSLRDAFPCKRRSLFLRRRVEARLLQSYLTISENIAAENLPFNLEDFQATLRNLIRQGHPLNPLIFANYAHLLKACEQEEEQEVCKILKAFDQLEKGVEKKFVNYGDSSMTGDMWVDFEHMASREIPEPTSFAPCRAAFFEKGCQQIEEALACLSDQVPDVYGESEVLVHQFFLLESNRFVAGSTFDLQGAILLKIDEDISLLDIVDLIIHEIAHQYLFLLSTLDPLCLNDPNQLHPSPLRQESRPLLGNYHSFFVLARLVYALSQLQQRGGYKGIDPVQLTQRIHFYREKYLTHIFAFFQTVRPTRVGERFMRSFQSIFE